MLGLAWYHALARAPPHHRACVERLRDLNVPRLQCLAAGRMSGQGPAKRDVSRARLRVAICTPEVVNSRHGGTTLTPNILSALARQGVEVHCWTAKEEAHIPAVGGYTVAWSLWLRCPWRWICSG